MDARPAKKSSFHFFTSRNAKKIYRVTQWVLLPLALAFIVAYFAPPPPPETKRPENQRQASSARPAVDTGSPGEMPPADTHSNPTECQAWAGSGQCKANPGFMLVSCAWSCKQIELVRERYNQRCPRPPNHSAVLAPGQMPGIFDRVLRDFPHLEPEQVSEDPPVIVFHNFFSDAETEAFIRHGKGRYAKSLGVGLKEDGTMGDVKTEIRTSSHGWCQHDACINDPHVKAVTERVADLTQTPPENAEFAQLVYYHACSDSGDANACAFYRAHNDYIDGDEHKLQGVRIFTLFGCKRHDEI